MPQSKSIKETRSVAIVASIVSMMAVGPLNFVLYKILFASYGEASAFFVMTGVNFIFVVYGAIALWYVRRRGEISAQMEALPRYPYLIMSALDCLGGLLAAMGAAATAGQLQTLLNQSLVPCTMCASSLFLGRHYSMRQCLGATVILAGAAVVVSSDFSSRNKKEDKDQNSISTHQESSPFSVLVYWSSNIPMSLSSVYKEHRFGSYQINTIYLTQQVSIYQFLFGFLFAPVESIPGVATRQGVPLSYVAMDFVQRTLEFFHGSKTAVCLLAYVAANFCLNTTGLFVTKLGGAALTAVAYSVLVPCSTLAFALPCLGPFREPLRSETIIGLLLVFFGFLLYELDDIRASLSFFFQQRTTFLSIKAKATAGETDPLTLTSPAGASFIAYSEDNEQHSKRGRDPSSLRAKRTTLELSSDSDQASFQERFIPLHMIPPVDWNKTEQRRRRRSHQEISSYNLLRAATRTMQGGQLRRARSVETKTRDSSHRAPYEDTERDAALTTKEEDDEQKSSSSSLGHSSIIMQSSQAQQEEKKEAAAILPTLDI